MIPSLGNAMPSDASWVAQRFEDLQRQLNELRAAQTLNAATIGSGGLTVNQDGMIQIIDQTSGLPVAFLGKALTVDGARQMVCLFWRDDGTPALQLGDLGTVPGHPHQQALQWFDRAGHIVLADDTVSGTGLATPHVDGGLILANTNITNWPSTTATVMTAIATGYYEVHNPKISFALWMEADTATTGQFQVQVNGTQIGTTQTVTGAFQQWTPSKLALPAGVGIGSYVAVTVLAAVTAGTGTVRAAMLNWRGDQS